MKAVVLVSGGLDSATTLAIATDRCYQCYALSFDYGQRHTAELIAAQAIARCFGVKEHKFIKLALAQFGDSALTDKNSIIPTAPTPGIPTTYVPARNTIFLSYALAWAEVLKARHIFIGVTAIDYSGYPDCRPEYIATYEKLANLATKASTEEGQHLTIHTPLINLGKAQIIKTGAKLGVDYASTVSCYQADGQGRACGLCNACCLRKKGFDMANIIDPTRYRRDNDKK